MSICPECGTDALVLASVLDNGWLEERCSNCGYFRAIPPWEDTPVDTDDELLSEYKLGLDIPDDHYDEEGRGYN